MILAVDIGNSNVVLGGFDAGKEPVFVRRLPSRRDWDGIRWHREMENLLDGCGEPEGCILSSVAPELTARIEPALSSLTGRRVLTVCPDLDDGLVLVGYDRKGLGNDRVADAVAALAQYQPPLAVFDLGTATTLSVLDGEGRFLGGMILPGVQSSVNALTAQASQLPKIRLEPPRALLGTDAVSCMLSGAVFGTAAQIDGLSARIEEHLGRPVTAVVTGGLSRLVCPHCRRPLQYDEHLLLKGLRYLYDRARKNGRDAV